MAMHYLDIETTGVNPRRSQIVTIQYQPVGRGGRPEGKLRVLKSWESDEKSVLESFAGNTAFFDKKNPWAFFPTGFNLGFEYRFLMERMRQNALDPAVPWDFALQKPSLDLQPVAILMNGGAFKGASLENYSAKPTSGHRVIEALKSRDWPAVEAYIEDETSAFFALLQRLHEVMPDLWSQRLKPLLQQGGSHDESDVAVATHALDAGSSGMDPARRYKNPWRDA